MTKILKALCDDPADVRLELLGLEKVDKMVEATLHLDGLEGTAPYDVKIAFWDGECDAFYVCFDDPLSEDQLPKTLGALDIKSFLRRNRNDREHGLQRHVEHWIAGDEHAKVVVEKYGESVIIRFSYGDDDPQYVLYKAVATVSLDRLKAYFRPRAA